MGRIAPEEPSEAALARLRGLARSRVAWSGRGAAVGIGFVLLAVLLRMTGAGERAADISGDPLVWVLFFAPLVGAAFGFLAGRELDEVRAVGESLEDLAEERSKRLKEAHRTIAAAADARTRLLAEIGEGVASFDAEGRIMAERSPAFDRLLPHAPSVDTVDRLLERCGAETETVAIARHHLWAAEDDHAFAAATAMLPASWSTKVDGLPRHIGLRYHARRDARGRLAEVLIRAIDETALGEERTDHARTQERLTRLCTAASDLEAYTGFVDAIGARLEAAQQARKAPDAPSDALLANLHALKGTLGLFGFQEAAGACHRIEQAYLVGDPVQPHWATLQRSWRMQSDDVAKALALGRARTVAVAPERLVAVRQALGRADLDAARYAVLMLRCHPLERVMARYKRYVARRAERFGKQVRFLLQDGSDEVAYHEVQRVDAALIHLFNNVVTHAANVDAVVQLTVGMFRREDGGQSWTVEDDGTGIDTERLAALAMQSGLRAPGWADNASDEAKLGLIFVPGLTTRTTADLNSGRGVGLGAARSAVRALGGDMRVASAIGAGTRFELWVPGRASMDLRRWAELQEPAPAMPADPAEPAEDEWVSMEIPPLVT